MMLELLMVGSAVAAASETKAEATEPNAAPEEPALAPPPVIASPGPQYADDARVFQGIPGIERAANGRLWATWYGGGPGEGPENYCMLATSGDDGNTWSGVKLVVDPPGIVRAFDPCLWHDPQGRLWFFWAQSVTLWDGRAGVWAVVTEQSDRENSVWSEPRRLCDGIMMNKPTVLGTGEWLLPAAIWVMPFINVPDPEYVRDNRETTGSYVVSSKDNGRTFVPLGKSDIEGRRCDEHMVVERRDGTLWMLARTTGGIGESFSADRGRSWSEGRPSHIQHIQTARFHIRRLASGKLLLVKHDPPSGEGRSHLKAFLSDDDGANWYGGLLIDERKHVSYPDAVQSPEGVVYLIYDRERTRAKEILMATFTEEDVAAGKCVSDKARLRVVVNRATGTN